MHAADRGESHAAASANAAVSVPVSAQRALSALGGGAAESGAPGEAAGGAGGGRVDRAGTGGLRRGRSSSRRAPSVVYYRSICIHNCSKSVCAAIRKMTPPDMGEGSSFILSHLSIFFLSFLAPLFQEVVGI